MANDLNLTLIADGQADDQWQSSNDGLTQLGNALADQYAVDFSAGNVTLTSTQYRSAYTFKPSAALAAARTLIVPTVKRPFVFHNSDATYTVTLKKTDGASPEISTSIAVAPGELFYGYTDGTSTGLFGAVVAAGGSTPGVGKQTITIPASALLPATTAGCANLAHLESSSNKINYGVLDFDATADEHAHFNIAMPKSWDEGPVYFQIWWTTSATDTDGVAWGLQAVAVSDNEAIDASWGTPIVVTDDAQGAALEMLVSAESSAVTIGGTPAAGDLVFFRIFRDVSDANDDMSEDARLISIKIIYTTDAATDD